MPKKLLRAIETLLENDPADREEKQKDIKRESLRQRLVALRDTELVPAFPDSPPERSLLRSDLLDEFVELRPKSRDEWFRTLSQQVRGTVDWRQVGRYLDRVLQTIAECDR